MPWADEIAGGRTFRVTVYRDNDLVWWTTGEAATWLQDLLTVFRPTSEEGRMFRAYWLTQIRIAKEKLDREDRG